jgi:hypothetical protein
MFKKESLSCWLNRHGQRNSVRSLEEGDKRGHGPRTGRSAVEKKKKKKTIGIAVS